MAIDKTKKNEDKNVSVQQVAEDYASVSKLSDDELGDVAGGNLTDRLIDTENVDCPVVIQDSHFSDGSMWEKNLLK